jgi:hypothetical protein
MLSPGQGEKKRKRNQNQVQSPSRSLPITFKRYSRARHGGTHLLTPALRRLRQENCEFEASLGLHTKTLSQKTKQNKNKNKRHAAAVTEKSGREDERNGRVRKLQEQFSLTCILWNCSLL